MEWEEWLGEWRCGRMPPGHRNGRVKGQCGITDHVQGEHNGSSGLREGLELKGSSELTRGADRGRLLNPYSPEREPRAPRRCVWSVFLSLDGAANTKGMPLCPCFGPALPPAPLHSSLLSVGLHRLDRLIGPRFCTCQTAAALLPLIPLSAVASARAASLRKSNLFSNYERRWA